MSKISLTGFVLGVFLALGPVAAEGDNPPKLRLGDAVQPKEYSIQLRLDPDSESFSGSVVIPINVVVPPPPVIWLNARDIEVKNAVVLVEEQQIAAEIIDGGDDYVGLRLEEFPQSGEVQILIEYTGLLRKDETSGLFRRKVAEDWYLFTQMEPMDARRVFPGFDEPGFKVPFEVSITVPRGNRAFFNTPVESETIEEDGSTTFRFAQSKPLPTYLLAIGVGPFDVVDAGTAGKNDTKLRIIVPSGKSEQAKWAAEATGPILELLEDYFGSPYPYEKLDQIAVPNFGGAMEHPGLVTYAQQLILRDPEEDTIPRRRAFASVCAHELAHMWFGDLVTMAWWDDLWLNESFATWMSNKIVDRWQPDWDRDVSAVRRRSGALGSDSLATARQIRQPIHSNDDIVNAFDGITYGKGASVLQMFESWIGEETFRKGVRSYVNRNAHATATAGDFLVALEQEAGKDMASAFATFLDQNGAPEITAKLRCPEQGKPFVALSQRRYVPKGSPSGAEQTWGVPLCVEYGRGDDVDRACTLMKERSATLELGTDGCPDWVLPNADLNGYYRVSYSQSMLDALFQEGGRRLSVPEQVGVVTDMQAMVLAGSMTHGDALTRLPQLLEMDNRHVLASTVGIVAGVDDMVPDDLRASYASFIRKTYGERARSLGWTPGPDEDEDTKLMRPGLVGLVADEGNDPKLIGEAKKLAKRWLKNRSVIDPQLVDLVLHIAASNGDEAMWKQMFEQAKVNTDEKQRNHLFGAMSSFRDEKLVHKNLDIILSGEFEIFEVGGLLFGALAEEATRELAYAWIQENFDTLLEKLPRGFQSVLPRTAGFFCDEEHAQEASEFFGPRVADIEGGPRALDQTLESIRICGAYRQAQRPSITAFLQKVEGAGPVPPS